MLSDLGGSAAAHNVIVDRFRRVLARAIPKISIPARIALLKAAWRYSSIPELRDIAVMLLESWPGSLTREVAWAIHSWPEEVFRSLPTVVTWKCKAVLSVSCGNLNSLYRCCANVPVRFRLVLASLIERWFCTIAPHVCTHLPDILSADSSRNRAATRHARDPLLYDALCGLIGHVDGLLDSFNRLVWRGMKNDMICSHASCFHVLYLDVILGLRLQSVNEARRVAAVLDTVSAHSTWDDATLDRFVAQAATAGTVNFFSHVVQERLHETLRRYLRHLQKADKSKLFAFPVTDDMVLYTDANEISAEQSARCLLPTHQLFGLLWI